MGGQRISGRDVVVTLFNGVQVRFDQVNLNVELGLATVTSQGRADGWVKGENSADGDLQLSTEELLKINEAIAADGVSWESFPEFDMVIHASVADQGIAVGVFGVKLNAPDFKADGQGGAKLAHTIKFLVTASPLVTINGVPLADLPTVGA
jgi:hypothetical protein